MGRKSRLKREARKAGAIAARELRIAIATHPAAAGSDDAEDLPLVRSAALYADKVDLLSLHSIGLGLADAIQKATGDAVLEHFRSLPREKILAGRESQLLSEQETFDRIVRDRSVSRDLPADEFVAAFREAAAAEQRRQADERTAQRIRSGYEQLDRLEERKILHVQDLEGLRLDALFASWWTQVQRLIEAGDTQLLFDARSAELIVDAIGIGLVRPGALFEEHAGVANVSAGLIARLPAFPDASLDDILALRHDLRDPLRRYRRTAAKLSKEAKVGVGDRSAQRIDDLWTSEVEPAFEAIYDALAEHSLIRDFAKRAREDVKTLLTEGAALSVGMYTLHDLADWIKAITTVGAPVVHNAVNAWADGREASRAAQQHDLFFLFDANRRLSNRRG